MNTTKPLSQVKVVEPAVRIARKVVAASYAAQGFGYATVATALPAIKIRYNFDDSMVSLVILIVVIGAVFGSITADRIATWKSSKVALVCGLFLQALTLCSAAMPLPEIIFVCGLFLYGIGLGAVDASSGMQAVIVQHRVGGLLMGSFFACYTAAAIAAALLASAAASQSHGTVAILSFAGTVAGIIAFCGSRGLDPEDFSAEKKKTEKSHLPMPGIWSFGLVIFAAFTLDSAVSSWSLIYLKDSLTASATIAPLAYALYQFSVLLTRFSVDFCAIHWGRRKIATTATLISIFGAGLVVIAPNSITAITGFALTGVGVGALVPLAFSSAGDLDPPNSNLVIARVNLFNYVGSIVGAVFLGLSSEFIGLGYAFAFPGLALISVFIVSKKFAGTEAIQSP